MTESIEPATDEAVKPISDANLAALRAYGRAMDADGHGASLEPGELVAILSRLTQAERERDEARALLKPFADFARIGNPRPRDLICGSTDARGRIDVIGADFHAALAALQAPQP